MGVKGQEVNTLLLPEWVKHFYGTIQTTFFFKQKDQYPGKSKIFLANKKKDCKLYTTCIKCKIEKDNILSPHHSPLLIMHKTLPLKLRRFHEVEYSAMK